MSKDFIIIDPLDQSVQYSDAKRSLEAYYDAIGCRLVEPVAGAFIEEADGHTIYVDEEYLFTQRECQKGFLVDAYAPGHKALIYGKGVCVGFKPETGRSTAPTLSLDDVAARVLFFEELMVMPDHLVLAVGPHKRVMFYDLKNYTLTPMEQ